MPKSGFLPAVLAVVVFNPLAAGRADAQEVAWRHDYTAARKEATETGRPLLLDFGYDGCVWCRKQDATTLRDPGIVRLLNERFVPVKVDAQRDERIARALGIESYPTVVLASAEGKVLGRQVGYADVSQMNALLNKAPARPDPAPNGSLATRQGPLPATAGAATTKTLELARREYDAGRFAESLRLCREVPTATPEAEEAQRLMGQIAANPAAVRQVQAQIADSLEALRPSLAASLDR